MAHTDKTRKLALRMADGDRKRTHHESNGKPSTIKSLKVMSARQERRGAKQDIAQGRDARTGHGRLAIAYWN